MPTYDFKCESCGEIREYIVPLTTSVPDKCKCGKEDCKLTRVESFGASKPQLKTGGFYETDYKNKG
jgi:putative FmdB family regulatory protein